jgi:hypothetical protein
LGQVRAAAAAPSRLAASTTKCATAGRCICRFARLLSALTVVFLSQLVARFGLIARSNLVSIDFGVVGPTRTRGKKGDSLGRRTPTVSHSCVLTQTQSTWTLVEAICWVPRLRRQSAAVGGAERRKPSVHEDSRKAACGCRSRLPTAILPRSRGSDSSARDTPCKGVVGQDPGFRRLHHTGFGETGGGWDKGIRTLTVARRKCLPMTAHAALGRMRGLVASPCLTIMPSAIVQASPA